MLYKFSNLSYGYKRESGSMSKEKKKQSFLVEMFRPLICIVLSLVKASPDNTQERGVRAEPAKHLLLLQFCRTGTRWRAQNVHC